MTAASDAVPTKFTPGRSLVAAHRAGTPLEGMPTEKTVILPGLASTVTGRRASWASRPAPRRLDGGGSQRVERFLQPTNSEVEYVVVRKRADVETRNGQARHVVRVHAVVHVLARVVVVISGDTRLEVHQP